MAISYPGIGYLTGYAKGDPVRKFQEGYDFTRGLKDEEAAAALIEELMGVQAQRQPGPRSRVADVDALTMLNEQFSPKSGKPVADASAALPGRELWFSPSRLFSTPEKAPAADPVSAYVASVEQAESAGNRNARNPRSSATGPFQFLEGTWGGLMQQYPDLQLTADGRTDPAQSRRAMSRFTQDNAMALAKAGISPSPGALYAAHFLGAGAAPRVLSAPADTPMTALVGPDVISANPHLSDMSQAEFVAWANRNGTGAKGGYIGPVSGAGGAWPTPMRAVQRPSGELMARLFQNRATRPLAVALAQQATAEVDQFQTFVGDDGVTYQMNMATGEQSVLRDPAKASAASINAGLKAPEVVTRYNETSGLEEKVVWDAATQSWQPFGGEKATTAQTRPMNPTTQKELFEADDAVNAGNQVIESLTYALELNDKAYDGPFSDLRGDTAAWLGWEGGKETALLKMNTLEQALGQLKATFGAAPTEGERKILLELQGSVNQPRVVREGIYKRAMELAKRRIQINQAKAAALRSGAYFEDGYTPGEGLTVVTDEPAASTNTTSTGVPWSIEQ